MSPRLRFILEYRWEMSKSPAEGWVWPAPTKSGHFEEFTLKKRHLSAIKAARLGPL